MAEVAAGDRILVRPGEVVPVDGLVAGQPAVLDESALTGESRPVTRDPGDAVASGVVNARRPVRPDAPRATADASTYAGIVRLVEPGESLQGALRAPRGPVRPAVRAAHPRHRGHRVAGLGRPGPCARRARRGHALPAHPGGAHRHRQRHLAGGAPGHHRQGRWPARDAGAMPASSCSTRPARSRQAGPGWRPSRGPGDPDDLLRMAASLEQASPHVLAASLVAEATVTRSRAGRPHRCHREPRQRRRRQGRRAVTVRVGSAAFASDGAPLPHWARDLQRRAAVDGTTNVYVAVDGTHERRVRAGRPRRAPRPPRAVRGLRRAGFTRIVMVTGDHAAVAELVAFAVGLDGVLADRTPAEKVDAVREETERSDGPVVMVGDGINDAPGARGRGRGCRHGRPGGDLGIRGRGHRHHRGSPRPHHRGGPDRPACAHHRAPERRSWAWACRWWRWSSPRSASCPSSRVRCSRRRSTSRSSSTRCAPSVAVSRRPSRCPAGRRPTRSCSAAHQRLAGGIARLRTTADRLGSLAPAETVTELRGLDAFLTDDLLPHEQEEDDTVHPSLATAMGNDEATAALHGTHNEIYRLARVFHELVETLARRGARARGPRGAAPRAVRAPRDPATAPVAGGGAVRLGHGPGSPAAEPATVSSRAPGAPAG